MRRARATATLLVVLCGAVALASLAVDTLAGPRAGGVEGVLLETSAVAALAAVSWLLLALGLAVVDATNPGRGPATEASAWLRPQVVRLLVGAVLGGGLAASPAAANHPPAPSPSVASPSVASPSVASPSASGSWKALDGLPPLLPPTSRPAAARHTPATPPATRSRVVVHPGDCLWDISEQLLSHGSGDPSDHTVAAAWHALYSANRGRVGPDPDLLLPGTALRVPASLTPTHPHELGRHVQP